MVLFSFTHKKCLGQSTGLSPRHRQSLAYPESQVMPTQRAPGAILVLFLFAKMHEMLYWTSGLSSCFPIGERGAFYISVLKFFDVSDFCKSFGG